MKLYEYGKWTLHIPFYTKERVKIRRGHYDPPNKEGIAYQITNSKITKMQHYGISSKQWDLCIPSSLDDRELKHYLKMEAFEHED